MTHATAPGAAADPAVTGWIRRHAHPVVGPAVLDAPLNDLAPLRGTLSGATVVGIGRPTHGARELTVLTHRILRLLVTDLGFRSLAMEEDWTVGVRIDAYLRTGEGDPVALLADAWPHHRTEETLDAIAWIRAYNLRHPEDPVRFVGVDVSGVRALAYDAVLAYVRRVAADRADELAALYEPLRPAAGIAEHIERYRAVPDKRPLLDRARRARDLVAALPPGGGRALALQHAEAVVGFHEVHAREDRIAALEPRMAGNVVWWHEHTGHRIVYAGGFTHTAVGASRRVSFPPAPPRTHRNAGSGLRERFGPDYVSVGLTFHHGTVHPGTAPHTVPAPPPDSADAVLSAAGPHSYLLDLRTAQRPAAVRRWLAAPARLRLIGPGYVPADDAGHHVSGGSLAEWFDVVGHIRRVTPVRYLSERGRPGRG